MREELSQGLLLERRHSRLQGAQAAGAVPGEHMRPHWGLAGAGQSACRLLQGTVSNLKRHLHQRRALYSGPWGCVRLKNLPWLPARAAVAGGSAKA